MIVTSFYTCDELSDLGIKRIGENAAISRKACFYEAEKIEIGNHVRIDDFCVLSGKIIIGDWVHIAVYSALFAGKYEIEIGRFSSISSRTAVYAESDDYTGISLAGAVRDERVRHTKGGNVTFGKHALIGTGCTILPGIKIGEGTSVGAMSLINHDLEEWSVYAGIPAKRIKDRNKEILRLEESYNAECGSKRRGDIL